MAAVTLVVGGVRSGKSRWAEELAARQPPVTYVATAQAGDAEMARRIADHQARRASRQPPWQTVEEPWNLLLPLQAAAAGTVLVECLPLWLTNRLLGLPGRAAQEDAEILADLARFINAAGAAAARVIVVSSETGLGLMPPDPLARRFGDLLGICNQRLAAAAAEVYGCVVGIPMRLK
ncbi:MAG: bifunctional adenosylcobinamide kinase/adenosylcobinamide-phosphate guanylyltransferase [Gemmataceae bacterium]|nr:bifunctional adenosylcobinamide kinase/adenosylcobinamide-phosphate guanylyltransferase [Gemmataceae bacterium]MDW8264655.1 bifunctional adenosylcobinamide kinase/adenosylcobinamide-phosphate guanylyltransferase [Gemmataceae bacterium]